MFAPRRIQKCVCLILFAFVCCYFLVIFIFLISSDGKESKPGGSSSISLRSFYPKIDSETIWNIIHNADRKLAGKPIDSASTKVQQQFLLEMHTHKQHGRLNFTYNIEPKNDFCSVPYLRPFLLVLVNSAVWHTQRRHIVRQTWGHILWSHNFNYAVYFLLARTSNTTIQSEVLAESKKYGDLIQGDFTEDYHDMVRKTGMGLHWVLAHCPAVPFVLKTDDDMFLNVEQITNHLRELVQLKGEASHTVYCPYFSGLAPAFNNDSKWYVGHDEFEGEYYPTFCRGSLFVITNDLIEALYLTAFKVPYVWLEDVFWTGIVADGVGNVTFVDWNHHGLYHSERIVDIVTVKKGYWFSHVRDPKKRIRLWLWTINKTPLNTVLKGGKTKLR